MHDDTTPSQDPRDRLTARRLGEALDAGRSLQEAAQEAAQEDETDSLLPTLLDYRAATAPRSLSAERSERLWDGLSARLGEEPVRPRMRLYTGSPGARLALAAALALSLLVTWLVLRPDRSSPVASAGDEIVVYTTADGSTITLRPYSQLFLVSREDRAERYRLEGEAYFSVTPDADRTFSVEAGEGLVAVLGTRFALREWGDATVLFVDEGRVRFSPLGAAQGEKGGLGNEASVVVAAGQRSAVLPSNEVSTPTSAEAAPYLDWLDAELVFDAQPAGDVAAEMAHHFNIRIDLPPSISGETLSGRLALSSATQALDDLGLVLGGRFVEAGNRRFRYEPPGGSE